MAQDYNHWEIIVISDDGHDYQAQLQDEGLTGNQIVFCSTGKIASGAAHARNVGLDRAKGDIITMLDCDDAFTPSRLSDMMPLVEKYGAAVSAIQLMDEASWTALLNHSIHMDNEKMTAEQVVLRCIHTFNVIMYDRRKIPHSYPVLGSLEDYIFLMLFYDHVDYVGFCPIPNYIYYKYPGTATHFTPSADDVGSFFTNVLKQIQQDVATANIKVRQESLKQQIHADMEFYIAAEAFYMAQAKINPTPLFHECIGAFLKTPQAAVRLSAKQ